MSQFFPDDDTLLQGIKRRVDEGRATGIVLGVLDRDGSRRTSAYGNPGPGASPLGPDSVFEIGSITKAFTGILLADMAARGEVDMAAPVRRYAPDGLVMPTCGAREITLADLASHRSGLPRLPGNLQPADPANPYADYSVVDLYEFLASYELPRNIGSQYEYSNLGMGLLGHVLAARAGVDYEALVRDRILDPLGMTMTGIALSPAMRAQLAIGHDVRGKPTGLWDLPTLAGAGALRSNVKDMLSFLDANIGEPRNLLERAMRVSHQPVGRSLVTKCGLGWHALSVGHHEIVCHDGGTAGYRAFIGFDPSRRVGVVVLTNSAHDADQIGMDLFNPARPVTRRAIQVPADILGRYVGEYEYLQTFTTTVTFKVTLDGDALMVQPGREAKVPIFAESPTTFFGQTGNIQFTFITDADGEVSGLVLDEARSRRSVKKVK